MSSAVTDEVHAPLIDRKIAESPPMEAHPIHSQPYDPMSQRAEAVYFPPMSPRGSFVSERNMQTSYVSGYAHKQQEDEDHSLDRSTKPPSRFGRLLGLKSLWARKWQVLFAGVTLVQGIICLTFEIYVYVKFSESLKPKIAKDFQKQIEVIPLFLPLFVFGYVYENVIVWDSLRAKNTIQIIGVCLANLALVIYTAFQAVQIKEALDEVKADDELKAGHTPGEVFDETKAYLIFIPLMMMVTTIFMGVCAWKLYQEFAWTILKIVGADYRMKQRYMHYQIYIALLKFDFFFLVGFLMQITVVTQKNDPEFAITIAAIPVTIVILLFAALFVRKEQKWGMAIALLLYFSAMAYFIFKLSQLVSTEHKWIVYYSAVRKPLITFAVVTLIMDVVTIANALLCTVNFGRGLKEYFESRRKGEVPQEQQMSNLEQGNHRISRLTID